jgi:hypothetical protein
MKARKASLIIGVFFLAIISKSFAQELYAGIGYGYGFPIAGTTIQNVTNNYSSITTISSTSYTSKTLSYGEGVNLGAFVGYMFNKNMGLELGISYLAEGGTTSTVNSTGNTGSLTPTFSATQTYIGSSLRIIPAYRMQLGEGSVRPYSVFGPIIGSGTVASYNTVGSMNETVYSGGYSYGFHAAMGARIMFSDNVAIYVEIALNCQNYCPASATTNGQTIEYVSSGIYNNNPNVSPQPQTYLPFSSLGASGGLQFSFGKKAKVLAPVAK